MQIAEFCLFCLLYFLLLYHTPLGGFILEIGTNVIIHFRMPDYNVIYMDSGGRDLLQL